MVNHEHKLTLKVLTPLHIGSAQEKKLLQGVDYVAEKGQVHVIDFDKLCNVVGANNLANFYAGNLQGGIEKFVRDNGARLPDVICYSFQGEPDGDITAFVKNPLSNVAYIPGSSIKGSLRSTVAAHFRQPGARPHKTGSDVTGELEGDIFRHIKVVDTSGSTTKLFKTKTFNLHRVNNGHAGGWKHESKRGTNEKFDSRGFISTFECIAVNQTVNCTIKLSNTISLPFASATRGWRQGVEQTITTGTTGLFQIVNEKTKKFITKEIAWLQKYPVQQTPQIVDVYKKLLACIPSDGSLCVFRIALGSGYHSITGDYKFDDFDKTGVHQSGRNEGKKYLKSRKFAFENTNKGLQCYPMGFVAIGAADLLANIEIVGNEAASISNAQIESQVQAPVSIIAQSTQAQPVFAKKLVKELDVVDALVIGVGNKVRVYLFDEKTFDLSLSGYKSELPDGSVIRVRVNQLDRVTHMPKDVRFVEFKK